MKKKLLATGMAAIMAAASLAGCGGSNNQTTTTAPGTAESTTAAATTAGTETAEESKNDDTTAPAGEKVTLNLCWWGNQTRNDRTKQAVDLYMSQNPNVQINVEFTDWSGYWDKLSAMAAGGNLPDIIQQDYSYISQYQKSGQLADLTPFIESGIIDTTDIPDSVIESGSIDGKCYAISLGSNANMMMYDQALVDQAGVTIPEQMSIDEFYNISQQIYEKTGAKTYYDGGINMMIMAVRNRSSHLFDELSSGNIDAMTEHFTNLEKFASAEFSIAPDLLAEKNPDVVETKPIIDGTTWNDFSFSNQYISISQTAGRDLGITMWPAMDNADAQAMYLKPSQFFSVAETSQNKEEAAKFINWFTNDVACNEILLGERGIPVNTKVADAILPKVDENSQRVFEYIAKVSEIATPIDAPDPAGKGEVEAIGKSIVEELRYGEISAQDAAKSYVESAKKILDEAKQ